ncbi:MAG: TIGR02594 family protein [Deltaproteobacteria bacterium]|nr:TIGR02594 family protein [Deltaproteobacteria bacterium]
MLLKQGMSGDKVLKVQKRLQELGFFTGTPRGNFGPITQAAVRAFQAANGLKVDGLVGDLTWGALFVPVEGTPQADPDRPPPGEIPPWLMEALKDLGKGIAEIPGFKHHPDIVAAHQLTALKATDDETPWCSSIMCAWIERAGLKSTRSAAAASWRTWGRELPNGAQRLGCIVVMTRVGGNHVGLYLDEDAHGVYLLGGNQGNRVSVRRYAWANITNFRWEKSDSAG